MTPESFVTWYLWACVVLAVLAVVGMTVRQWPLTWRSTLTKVMREASREIKAAIARTHEAEGRADRILEEWHSALDKRRDRDPWADYAGRVLRLVESDRPVSFAAYMGPIRAHRVIDHQKPVSQRFSEYTVQMVRVGVSLGFSPETPPALVAEEIGRRVESFVKNNWRKAS